LGGQIRGITETTSIINSSIGSGGRINRRRQMTRSQFLIALETYWRDQKPFDENWMDVVLDSVSLFDACQKLGFFK
jgi:hypothetical protein